MVSTYVQVNDSAIHVSKCPNEFLNSYFLLGPWLKYIEAAWLDSVDCRARQSVMQGSLMDNAGQCVGQCKAVC